MLPSFKGIEEQKVCERNIPPGVHLRQVQSAGQNHFSTHRQGHGRKLVIYWVNLYFAGDERFGAIGVSTSNSAFTPSMRRPLRRLKDVADLNAAIRIVESEVGELQEQQRALLGASGSLGGAKPKAVVATDGEDWVLNFLQRRALRSSAGRARQHDAGA